MNKDFLVVLLEKDIKELALLTEGFEHLEGFPKPIILLAKQKAQSILANLEALENINFKKDDALNATAAESKKQTVVEENIAEMEIEKELDDELLDIYDDDDDDAPVDFTEDISDYTIQNKKQIVESPIVETYTNVLIEEKPTVEVSPVLQPSVVIENKEEVADVVSTSMSVNENIRIADIKQAINIGDRFRFQRELFGGNGEVMNKTISYLNQLNKFEEAVSFLNNKFGWAEDNQHAQDFLVIIKRRYL